MEWFVGRNGHSSGPFATSDLIAAARRGELSRDDLVWRAGMDNWAQAATVAELWEPPPLPSRPIGPKLTGAVIATRQETARETIRHELGGFRDPTQVTTWLKYLLYGYVVAVALMIGSDLLQLQLLSDFKAGRVSLTAVAANDDRQRAVAFLQLGVLACTVVVFGIWIYRANFNARELGATGMRFSPGWAVGWYFIPIAFLWKPYQAMKEIWQASKNPLAWQKVPRGSILPWWWTFWIAGCLMGKVTLPSTLGARTVDGLIAATTISLVNGVVDIIAALLAAALVNEVTSMQMGYISGKKH